MLILFFTLLLSSLCGDFYVAVPTLDIFSSDSALLEKQALYGDRLEIIEVHPECLIVKTSDGHTGYCDKEGIIHLESHYSYVRTKSLFTKVYAYPNYETYPLLTLPFNSKVSILKTSHHWAEIELIGGKRAYVQKADLNFNPQLFTLDEMIEFSKKFIGLPYVWGGCSTFGYDCSSFMQMLFKTRGIHIPRFSKEQAQDPQFYDVDDLEKGDLLFFHRNEEITHVGLYLGNGEFIHSCVLDAFPGIQISHLNTTQCQFFKARRLKR